MGGGNIWDASGVGSAATMCPVMGNSSSTRFTRQTDKQMKKQTNRRIASLHKASIFSAGA